jgi:hypothetical protein
MVLCPTLAGASPAIQEEGDWAHGIIPFFTGASPATATFPTAIPTACRAGMNIKSTDPYNSKCVYLTVTMLLYCIQVYIMNFNIFLYNIMLYERAAD